MVDNSNIEKLTESFFQEKFIFAQIWAKKAQNDPKKRFWIFWKIFVMLVFPGNNLKSKLIYLVIDILPTHLAKFWVSSYGSKCCQPIKLQDSLKCNIVRKKWIMKFIFCMQINIEVFSKTTLSFCVSVTRHVQSTQNKFAYLCNISIKAWEMKLIFCLQINLKVFYKMIVSLWVCIARQAQSSKNNQFTISFNISRKTWRMKLIFCLLINVEAFFKLILSF